MTSVRWYNVPLVKVRHFPETLKSSLDDLYGSTGLKTRRFSAIVFEERGDRFNFDITLEEKAASGQLPSMRVCIGPDIAVTTNPPIGNDHALLVISRDSQTATGWRPHPNANLTALLSVPVDHCTELCHDIFVDNVLANSYPYAPIISSAIKTNGRDWLYRRKVDFVLRKGLQSWVGPVNSQSPYVSFCSCFRKEKSVYIDYIGLVNLWDEFCLKILNKFLKDRADIVEEVSRYNPAFFGNISQANWEKLATFPENSVIAFKPGHTNGLTEKAKNSIRASFNFAKITPKNMSFCDGLNFRPSNEMREFLKAEHVHAARLLLPN